MAIFHEYPYTNFHDLNLDWIIKIVKELKAIVDSIDVDEINRHFSTIDGILAEHTADIAALQAQSTAAASAISTLQTTVSGMEVDITQIHSQIDGVIDQIAAAVTELTGDVNALDTELDNYKTATNTRLDNLEAAAFDPSQIVMSNMPFNFALSTLNGNKTNMRIVVDGSGSPSDSIQWVDGGQFKPYGLPEKQKFNSTFKIPRFYSSGNQCHLVIPSVLPIVYRAQVNWTLYFYANRWIGESSNNIGIAKVGPINFTDLLAEGGYSKSGSSDSGSACFNEMELFANQETGCYDLHIYNGRNGHYAWINDYMFSSIMILPIDLGNMTQAAGIQKYFNLLNTYLTQSTSNIDGKISSAVSQSQSLLEDLITVSHDSGLKESIVMNPIHFEEDSEIVTAVTRNNSLFSIQRVFDHYGSNYDFTVAMVYVDLTMRVAGIESNTDTTVGQFLVNGSIPLNLAHTSLLNLSIAVGSVIEHEYASLGTDGSIAINVKNPNGTAMTGTARINGYAYIVVDNTAQ